MSEVNVNQAKHSRVLTLTPNIREVDLDEINVGNRIGDRAKFHVENKYSGVLNVKTAPIEALNSD